MVGLKYTWRGAKYEARHSLNRTMVGLKFAIPLAFIKSQRAFESNYGRIEIISLLYVSHGDRGLNRTMVGLKFLHHSKRNARKVGLNRTMVGLK